ncbi:hypothetical protein CRUP_036236 [Coryphaenoides rupestris]|nr:hypothetical protein CRUP_036236 [Coryphaenoides rupestris]
MKDIVRYMAVSEVEVSQVEAESPSSERECSFRGTSEMEHTQAFVDLTVQPEDQDADLEHTLNSHHSTLLEMVDQIGKACRRQYITEAANSVCRRYRRQRLKKSLIRKTTTSNPQSRGESHRRSVHHPNAFPSPPPLSPRGMVQQHCPSPSRLSFNSPRSSSATGSLTFQRRHSFDSAPRPSVTCSPARLEEEFTSDPSVTGSWVRTGLPGPNAPGC